MIYLSIYSMHLSIYLSIYRPGQGGAPGRRALESSGEGGAHLDRIDGWIDDWVLRATRFRDGYPYLSIYQSIYPGTHPDVPGGLT